MFVENLLQTCICLEWTAFAVSLLVTLVHYQSLVLARNGQRVLSNERIQDGVVVDFSDEGHRHFNLFYYFSRQKFLEFYYAMSPMDVIHMWNFGIHNS
jgi:hypothetical protein